MLPLTPGNHGRAVAHTARLLGLAARIYVPSTVEQWSIDAIASEGCPVTVVDADYDGAVQAALRASRELGDLGLFIQDTSFERYTDIPGVSEPSSRKGEDARTHESVGTLTHSASSKDTRQ